MKFINPSVEWWPQKTIAQQIARVGRICYKAKGKEPADDLTGDALEQFIEHRDKKRCEDFWRSNHHSMFRHGTAYFFIKHDGKLPKWIWALFTASPYIDSVVQDHHVWISTNMHFLTDHDKILELLDPYGIDEKEFIERAMQYHCNEALMLLRMTLVVTTQRIQGESYNRKSPNNIAEQSTRYVNLDKKGGVLICRPHWEHDPIANFRQEKDGKQRRFQSFRATTARWASHFGYWIAEKVYQYLLWCGLTPQDARGNLTFNTYTVVGYTYNLYEWRHIMDMRLRDLTGVAHKDAKVVAEQISDIINTRMRQYIPDFEI